MFDGGVDFTPPPLVVMAEFHAAERAIPDFEAALKDAVAQVAAPAIATNFAVGGRPPWTPLSDITIMKRMHNNTGVRILDETGNLWSIAIRPDSWQIQGSVAVLTSDGISEAPYGTFHQLGTSKMPKREWATFTDEDMDKVTEVLGNHATATLLSHISILSIAGSIGNFLGGAIGGMLRGIFR